MASKKTIKLTWKRGLTIFAISWAATFLAVYVLRQILIPADEMACYHRIGAIQKAVNQWNRAHPDKIINDEID